MIEALSYNNSCKKSLRINEEKVKHYIFKLTIHISLIPIADLIKLINLPCDIVSLYAEQLYLKNGLHDGAINE